MAAPPGGAGLRARIALTLNAPGDARAVEGALSPEAGEGMPRAAARLRRQGEQVSLDVEAEDATAMRAAVNAYLRWARTALDATRVSQHDPGE